LFGKQGLMRDSATNW